MILRMNKQTKTLKLKYVYVSVGLKEKGIVKDLKGNT